MKNGDMPAMPVTQDKEYSDGDYLTGLTKREEFAKAAMQGLCADPNMPDVECAAVVAVRMADALLAELAKEQDQ